MSMSLVPCLKKVTCSNVLFFTFCIYMQFSKLTEAEVWLDASTQIFFSLGLAFGGLISMASYNPINNNIVRDALLVSIVNCGTSIFAGITIFGILGYKVRGNGIISNKNKTCSRGMLGKYSYLNTNFTFHYRQLLTSINALTHNPSPMQLVT